MDRTPTKQPYSNEGIFEEENFLRPGSQQKVRIRKPPPITPRRFTKFFTPRPRSAANAVRTSRRALRAISASTLNSRQHIRVQDSEELTQANENANSRKRRKLDSIPSTPTSANSDTFNFLPSSQEPIRSSPIKHNEHDSNREHMPCLDEEEEEQDNEDDASTVDLQQPCIKPYQTTSVSRKLLHTRLTGKHSFRGVPATTYQSETASFFSSDRDLNNDFATSNAPSLPFSIASCNTNPIVATGDEEGWIRLVDTSNATADGTSVKKTIVRMRPHDNALMDLEFSSDDAFLATASGDQTCQVIDVKRQLSLYTLKSHTSSVKRIQFQPGSGDKVLASCGRDGRVNFWDLRIRGLAADSYRSTNIDGMQVAQGAQVLTPVNTIADAHTAGSKYSSSSATIRPNHVPGRNDFSITSLTFLGQSRSHMIATASEVDTVIKIWDMRVSHALSVRSRSRLPTPVSCTQEPENHAVHRRFGINSLVLGTDCSRLYALSRDHTVYAYSTSHLVMGSTQSTSSSVRTANHPRYSSPNVGLGPLFGLQHPFLRVSTFWPRLSIRKSTFAQTELLAVGSSDDCAVLFPTSEQYLSKFTQKTPALHVSPPAASSASRPTLSRSFSSSFSFSAADQENHLPIYRHGTPLVGAHNKEVTSLIWTSEGNLCTNSDDYTMRCWRENPEMARRMRTNRTDDPTGVWKKGWASVGVEGFDAAD